MVIFCVSCVSELPTIQAATGFWPLTERQYFCQSIVRTVSIASVGKKKPGRNNPPGKFLHAGQRVKLIPRRLPSHRIQSPVSEPLRYRKVLLDILRPPVKQLRHALYRHAGVTVCIGQPLGQHGIPASLRPWAVEPLSSRPLLPLRPLPGLPGVFLCVEPADRPQRPRPLAGRVSAVHPVGYAAQVYHAADPAETLMYALPAWHQKGASSSS